MLIFIENYKKNKELRRKQRKLLENILIFNLSFDSLFFVGNLKINGFAEKFGTECRRSLNMKEGSI